MSLATSKRFQWMVQKVALSFNLPEAESEKCFRDHLKLVDQFMSDMTVPPKLFVFYQPRQAKTPELFITAGRVPRPRLQRALVWFVCVSRVYMSCVCSMSECDSSKILDHPSLFCTQPLRNSLLIPPFPHFLFLFTGSDMDKLEGKCVYFIRDSVKPISNKVAQDSTVICGETSGNLLQVYEDVLSQIYAPIITNLDEWGKISDENQKKTFITDVSGGACL
jgi:hypothetical protein